MERFISVSINGASGSGKTLIMGEIARHLQSLGMTVQCCEDRDCDGEASEVQPTSAPLLWEPANILIIASIEPASIAGFKQKASSDDFITDRSGRQLKYLINGLKDVLRTADDSVANEIMKIISKTAAMD